MWVTGDGRSSTWCTCYMLLRVTTTRHGQRSGRDRAYRAMEVAVSPFGSSKEAAKNEMQHHAQRMFCLTRQTRNLARATRRRARDATQEWYSLPCTGHARVQAPYAAKSAMDDAVHRLSDAIRRRSIGSPRSKNAGKARRKKKVSERGGVGASGVFLVSCPQQGRRRRKSTHDPPA